MVEQQLTSSRHSSQLNFSRSTRIPALGLLALTLFQQALHNPTLHLVLAPALAPLGVTEDGADLHAIGLDCAGGRAGGVVLVGVLGLVGVSWLGLVVGLGVLRVVLVVLVVLLVVLLLVVVVVVLGVLGLDRVDSALDWLGWRCYGVLAEGLVVGGCGGQLGGRVGGVVGVLGDFDGLDGGVRVGFVVSVVVGVLGRLLDDWVRLDVVVRVVGVLGDFGGFDDGGVRVGVGVGVGGVVSGGHGD